MKLKKLLTTITLSVSFVLLSTNTLPVFASEVTQNQILNLASTKIIKVIKTTLNKKTTTMNVGANETLIATISPTTATNKNATWKSSNTKIATIDSTGNVKGIKAGKATITVTTVDGKKTAKCTVTVTTANYPVTFKDANLEQAVRKAINKPIMGPLYTTEVQKITELVVECKDLVDIGGIESLTNLKTLGLSNNKIIDITPLKGLVNLQSLFLTSNKITDVDALKGLTKLQNLGLGYNQINDFDVLRGLINLKALELRGVTISDTDKQSLKKALPKCHIIW